MFFLNIFTTNFLKFLKIYRFFKGLEITTIEKFALSKNNISCNFVENVFSLLLYFNNSFLGKGVRPWGYSPPPYIG